MSELGWVAVILIVGVLGIALWVMRRKQNAQRHAVLKTVIDIYASGDSHVEYIPSHDVHPVDIVQLAISYISNVMFVTAPDLPELRQPLLHLFDLVMKYGELSDAQQYRDDLWTLAEEPHLSPLANGRYAAGESERFQVWLIRGRQIDYSLSEFAVKGYVPNLSRSAQLLYCETAQRVDDTYLKLMHHALIGVILQFEQHKPEAMTHQTVAFATVEYVLQVFPGSIANSPERVLKHGSVDLQHR